MKLKYDHPSLSNIIVHFSFNDLEYSSMIAEFIIESLDNKEKIDDIPLFFKVNHISLSTLETIFGSKINILWQDIIL